MKIFRKYYFDMRHPSSGRVIHFFVPAFSLTRAVRLLLSHEKAPFRSIVRIRIGPPYA